MFPSAYDESYRLRVARQLIKSGTSIGANVWEAQNAESKADFIHKLKIAAKEADETAYWLILCKNSDGYKKCDELLEDCNAIIRVLSKIISSSKSRSINWSFVFKFSNHFFFKTASSFSILALLCIYLAQICSKGSVCCVSVPF